MRGIDGFEAGPLQAGAASVSNKWYVLALLVAVYTMNYLDRTIIYILQEPIKAEFKLSDTQIGLMSGTMFGVCYAIFGVPIARLAERRSRSAIIAVSMVIWSVLTSACGLAAGFGSLLALRAGVAIGEAGATPPAHSIIADYFSANRRATALAIYAMGVPMGQFLGSVLGGSLAHTLNWRLAFAIVGMPGILLALLFFFTVREPPRGHSDAHGEGAGDGPPPSLLDVLRHARRQSAFIQVLIGSTIAMFAGMALTAFTGPFFLRNFNLTLGQVGGISGGLYGVSSAAGMLAGGLVVDRLARRDPSSFGWLPGTCLSVSCPLLVLGYLQSSWFAALALMIVPGITRSAFHAPTYSVMHNSFPASMRATIASILLLSHALIGLALGPLAFGAISDILASHVFTAGDYATSCGHSPVPQFVQECRRASGDGIRYASIVMSVIFLWAAGHFFYAGKLVARQAAVSSAIDEEGK
ncbi:spinster family MFS transporter [Sphingobium ummariense]